MCRQELRLAEIPADAVILEVGLGGRFDATNVIDRPAVSVIMPISLDHQAYLGDRVELIAAEKAGIMKREPHNNPEKAIPRKERKAMAEAKAKGAKAA